jgi:hypothetical protein
MTTNARALLAICDDAATRLSQVRVLVELDPLILRLAYVGLITQIRAIGYVLKDRDRDAPDKKGAIDAAHKRWQVDPEHAIFREMIDGERNAVAKRGEWNAEARLVLLPAPDDKGAIGFPALPMITGQNANQDLRVLVMKALSWWREQLDAIDTDAERRRRPGVVKSTCAARKRAPSKPPVDPNR